MPVPIFYFDLGSPYVYLAFERAEQVLGAAPDLEPILLGAIFKWRGFGSWSQTADRDRRIAEIEARAARRGLPPIAWQATWPADGLTAMRAATWARQQGAVEPFARAVLRHAFVDGEDVSSVEALAAIADEVGLAGHALPDAVRSPAIKEALRAATERAWEVGVRGVPTVAVGAALFYGDDQLEQAAALLRG